MAGRQVTEHTFEHPAPPSVRDVAADTPKFVFVSPEFRGNELSRERKELSTRSPSPPPPPKKKSTGWSPDPQR